MKFTSRLAGLAFFALAANFATAQTDKPNTAVKPAEKLKEDFWRKRHEAFLEKYKNGGVDVLFVGDSITQGWEGSKKVWDENFKDWKPGNIGIGGDQTQHVLWRITEGKEIEHIDPKVVVLMIGTNNGGNTPEQIAEGIAAIINEFKKQKPKAKILLLGVFPRAKDSKKNKDPKMTAADELQPKIAAINAIIAKFDDGKTVHYLDIGKSFLDKDGNLQKATMPDYLHLSADGYAKWAAAIKEPVEKLLK